VPIKTRTVHETGRDSGLLHRRSEIFKLRECEIGRLAFRPGGAAERRQADRQDQKRQAPRFQYFMGGRLAMRMDGGRELVAESAIVVDRFGATITRSAEQWPVISAADFRRLDVHRVSAPPVSPWKIKAIPGTNVRRCLGFLIIEAESGDWIPGGEVADGRTGLARNPQPGMSQKGGKRPLTERLERAGKRTLKPVP